MLGVCSVHCGVWFQATHRRRDVATEAESQTRNMPGYINHLTTSADGPLSHPVKPVPPVADVPYNKSSVDKPCSSVRVVSTGDGNTTD